MGRILDVVERFLESDDWPVSRVEGRTVIKTGFEGKNGQFTCYAQERNEQEQFVFYSIFPVRTPENKTHEVAEFVTRANYGMIIGNFELDYSDGEIRYKTSVDVEDFGRLRTPRPPHDVRQRADHGQVLSRPDARFIRRD